MAAKIVRNGRVVLPVGNYLDGGKASSLGICLDYLIKRGEEKILLDFSRVRQFDYFGMAVLFDILAERKRRSGLSISFDGLSQECLTAASSLGFERLLTQ